MAQGKVFIPPSISNFASVTINGITYPVELDTTWYLFWSRKIGADSYLLGGDTFAVDQNILANASFQPHVPMPTMTDWATDQNVISMSAFQPHVPIPSMMEWRDTQNIIANAAFQNHVPVPPMMFQTDAQYILPQMVFGG